MKWTFAPVLALAALSEVCAVVVQRTPAGSPERAAAALLLVLVLPGLALRRLLMRGESGGLLLVPALSLALTILVSAGLYVAGIRLGLTSWSQSLAAAVICFALASLPWRTSLTGAHRHRIRLSAVTTIAILCAVGLVASATIVTARSVHRQHREDRFTQLWALPGGDRITVGIYNHEGSARRYLLRARLGRRLLRSEMIPVAAGASWTRTLALLGRGNLRFSVTARGQGPRVYRWVELHAVGSPPPSSRPRRTTGPRAPPSAPRSGGRGRR